MFRTKPPEDKRLNDLKVAHCFDKKSIQKAWKNYYGFVHYYMKSKDPQELEEENLDIESFCFSLGYSYVTDGRDSIGRPYWRFSSWGNWEYV